MYGKPRFVHVFCDSAAGSLITGTAGNQAQLRCLNVADVKLRSDVHLQAEPRTPVLPVVTAGGAEGAEETVLGVKTALWGAENVEFRGAQKRA